MTKSILLVDDSAAIRVLTRTYLESAPGLKICGEASDGAEAIRKALELSPDLIVMDFSMPGMNGLEAARELKLRMPQVPIILLTLYSHAVRFVDANDAGISAVISKSEPQKLLPQVMVLLERPGPAAPRGSFIL